MENQERNRWIDLADIFYAQGDFRGMRACAREILELDSEDHEGLAIFAQALLFLGEREKAQEILEKLESEGKTSYRLLLAEGELYASEFLLQQEYIVLEELEEKIEEQPAESRTPSDWRVLERARGLLADAYQLGGYPEKSAQELFKLSEMPVDMEKKAYYYSKGLFLTNYRKMPADKSRKLHEGFSAFFSDSVKFSHENRVPGKKLRIGYISPDFRLHAAAYFFTPLLRDYDQSSFEVFAYMAGRSDGVTARFKVFPVNWRDVSNLPAIETARIIYNDKIDILVDLSGHTQDSCLPVLAYRPAPIQISGIGYMNTTGLETVDYFLSDNICMPKGEMPAGFTEKILRLQHSHLCYQPETVRKMPEPGRVPPSCKNGYITFGSFNNFSKVFKETLLLWREILERVPGSRMIIKGKICSIPAGRDIVADRLNQIGIDMGRIELRPYSPDYLEQYRDVDIALDTMPYTGGLTTCAALYMGVPVITLAGRTHGERFSASILTNAGLSELVADSELEYVNKACRLAESPELLKKLHGKLRENLLESGLMNGKKYMKELESAYFSVRK